jgi:hypothetical protein
MGCAPATPACKIGEFIGTERWDRISSSSLNMGKMCSVFGVGANGLVLAGGVL